MSMLSATRWLWTIACRALYRRDGLLDLSPGSPRVALGEAEVGWVQPTGGKRRDSVGCTHPTKMGYRSLAECVRDLESTGQLVVIDQEVDPHLEVAAIQRRVYQAGGPALLFRRARGTAFPLLGNLFGTLERARFLFRDTLDAVAGWSS